MNSAAPKTTSLSFRLQVDDGWPPVAIESLPFRELAAGYECLVAPLYVKDLAVGDAIQVLMDTEGVVDDWHHLRRSNHSTVWLLRLQSSNNIPEVLASLRELGCDTVGLEHAGSYAIDVPTQVSIEKVDEILATLDSQAVATAFPAMRHANS